MVGFWADHPLIAGLRPVGGEHHVFRGERIQGNTGVWGRISLSLSRMPDTLPDSRHIHLKWLDPDGAAMALDLWPFVTLEVDPYVNRRIIWVITRRDQKRRWWRRSLHNGKEQIWKDLPKETERSLERLLPGPSRHR